MLAGGIAGQLVVAQENGDAEVAERLAGGRVHHQLPATPFLDVGDADEAEEEIGDGVAGCEQPCELLVQPNGLDQHRGQVVRRYINARQLLHRLRACSKYQPSDCARARGAGAAAQ